MAYWLVRQSNVLSEEVNRCMLFIILLIRTLIFGYTSKEIPILHEHKSASTINQLYGTWNAQAIISNYQTNFIELDKSGLKFRYVFTEEGTLKVYANDSLKVDTSFVFRNNNLIIGFETCSLYIKGDSLRLYNEGAKGKEGILLIKEKSK